MILLDQHPKVDLAGPTSETVVAGPSDPSLPDYETSQALEAQHNSDSTTLRKFSLHNTGNRFWRATLYALAIYVALSITIAVPLLVTKLRDHRHRPPLNDELSTLSTPLDYANAGFLAMDRTCNVWDASDEFSASASYTLEAEGSFSIRSTAWQEATDDNNSQIRGNLTVDINPDPSVSSAIFHVTLSSSASQFYQHSLICFDDEGSNRGLSIYIPSNLTELDSLSLNVTLLFPQASSLALHNLVTYLPMFSQRIGFLAPDIGFDKVELEGAGMDIHCDSLKSRQITVKNSLAAITGAYNASSNLKLDTVSGPINANIILVQDETSKAPTFFSLDTGNSQINAEVTLLADPSEFGLHPIAFLGHVGNFNGPLSLDVTHHSSTPTVSLDLVVQNNQAESNVTLDDKFVGLFDLQTKLASVDLDWESGDDPLGQNRQRVLVYDEKGSNRRRGWIGWGPRPDNWDPHEGKVTVISSLSPILLQVGSGVS
ncbi:hypothetical protein VKT23_000793 [Stygiomarasmius scandens]|uniref:Uncharacterized protein n=1 Tax=Marasmiellus scandens TaxID=2682957 RepID=A0ABR1K554_9AGAR